jgi:hypothetical protein
MTTCNSSCQAAAVCVLEIMALRAFLSSSPLDVQAGEIRPTAVAAISPRPSSCQHDKGRLAVSSGKDAASGAQQL